MSNVAGKAYGMNVLTPMHPRHTWINRLLFMLGRTSPALLSGLLNLSIIHFARWFIIKRRNWPGVAPGDQPKNDYMFFVSNFNGTWDQYIDSFSDGIPNGLDLFWYSSIGYPGSIPITPFKDYIRLNQIDCDYYYNSTPCSAQRDIKSALRVWAAIDYLQQDIERQSSQEFAALFAKVTHKLQHDLASAGPAPFASTDTLKADQQRQRLSPLLAQLLDEADVLLAPASTTA
ncbi:MAG: hypothetical protein VKO26_06565 [Cyanobacteriota bacterium]|nr:hypothetical protein [Cyanobacteriota bacterium]